MDHTHLPGVPLRQRLLDAGVCAGYFDYVSEPRVFPFALGGVDLAVAEYHEELHLDLSRRTGFDVLVRALAQARRAKGMTDAARAHLDALLGLAFPLASVCHEMFATYTSLTLPGISPSARDRLPRAYMELVERAEAVVGPATQANDGGSSALGLLITAAMSPDLSELASSPLHDLGLVGALLNEAAPDVRLARLLDGADASPAIMSALSAGLRRPFPPNIAMSADRFWRAAETLAELRPDVPFALVDHHYSVLERLVGAVRRLVAADDPGDAALASSGPPDLQTSIERAQGSRTTVVLDGLPADAPPDRLLLLDYEGSSQESMDQMMDLARRGPADVQVSVTWVPGEGDELVGLHMVATAPTTGEVLLDPLPTSTIMASTDFGRLLRDRTFRYLTMTTGREMLRRRTGLLLGAVHPTFVLDVNHPLQEWLELDLAHVEAIPGWADEMSLVIGIHRRPALVYVSLTTPVHADRLLYVGDERAPVSLLPALRANAERVARTSFLLSDATIQAVERAVQTLSG